MSRGIVRFAYLLLAIMTLVSFGGPFLIGTVLRGGDSASWPPDRPIEWLTVVGVTGIVVVVLIGLSVIWLANVKQLQAVKQATLAAREARLKADGERGGA